MDKVELRLRGTTLTVRSVRMRPRDEVPGSKSPARADGGAVALRLVLMSCFFSLPDHALLASYWLCSSTRFVRYGRWGIPVELEGFGRGLRAVTEVVTKSRRNADEFV